MISRYYYIFLLALIIWGCQNKTVYQHAHHIAEYGWTYADPVLFDFNIADTSKLYSLALEVTCVEDYPYQNIYIETLTTFPQGDTLRNILSLELADDNGLWNGNCRGEICTVHIPFQERTYFQYPGDYQIRFDQYMRNDSLVGIQEFELSITELDL